jgi:hypothetical protein
MHNSDDYFDDDIVFDEQTLAVLDQEEHKFAQSSRPLQNPPPPKRQKTNNGWKAGGSRVDSFDDPEDLPEISVQDDGSYGLGGYRAVNGANTTWRREVVNSHSSGPGHPGHTLNASATPPVRSAQHIPVHATGRAPSSYGPSSQNLSHIPQGQTSLRDIFVPPGPQLSRPTEVQAAEELRKQMEEVCVIHGLPDTCRI